MNLDIQPLSDEDYDKVLKGWWLDWKWNPPAKEFLPENGTGGFLELDNKTPICAGFIYLTNSKVAWVDWIISNKNYKDRDKRKHALTLLVSTLTKLAKSTGYIFGYALMKNKSLIEIYKELGYTEGETYNSEMIIKLK